MKFKIQGSDLAKNKNTERLVKSGIKVYFGQHKKNLKKATMIVISSAIKKNNPELKFAKYKKLPVFKRGDMLANIVALKKNIVIAGSHGKTTTTSLVANILLEAGFFDENIIQYGGEDIDLSAKIWDKYRGGFIFSKKSNSIHFHRRSINEFCLSMKTYGEYNLPILINRYPQYKKELGADWIYSLKGYIVFNPLLNMIIKSISLIRPLHIFVRYIVINSVISGARNSKE